MRSGDLFHGFGIRLDHLADPLALLHDLPVPLNHALSHLHIRCRSLVCFPHQCIHLIRNRTGHIGQLSDLLSDHGKSSPRFPRFGSLDGGVERQHIGLVSDTDDLRNRFGDGDGFFPQLLQLGQSPADLFVKISDPRVNLGGQLEDLCLLFHNLVLRPGSLLYRTHDLSDGKGLFLSAFHQTVGQNHTLQIPGLQPALPLLQSCH